MMLKEEGPSPIGFKPLQEEEEMPEFSVTYEDTAKGPTVNQNDSHDQKLN